MNKHLSDGIHQKQTMLNKVPEITIFFWITKILTTGMGEVFSDYLCRGKDPIIAVVLVGIGLMASFMVQFSIRRYVVWIYWLTVVMVSIFGTMAADVLHVVLGVQYIDSTMFFMVMLTAILVIWYTKEKTLSIHSVFTHRREVFYWATVLATFALGTAVGDMTASTMKLGYLASGVMFAILIAIPIFAYKLFGLNEVFSFWFAYIITRPLGASFADWIGVSQVRGGLGLGTGPVSLALTIVILCLVGYLSITHRDIKDESSLRVTNAIVNERSNGSGIFVRNILLVMLVVMLSAVTFFMLRMLPMK